MKNKKMWLPVALLVLFITVLCWILGCVMYNTNLKSVYHNLTSVEYTDSIENIRYSMHFGKKLASFSGMDAFLKKCIQDHPETENLYITTLEGEILFAYDNVPLPEKVTKADAGDFLMAEGSQYSRLPIGSEGILVVKKSGEEFRRELFASYIRMGIVALMGLLVTELLIIGSAVCIQEEKKSNRAMVTVLTIWVIGFSSYVGASTWIDYENSLGEIKDRISSTITADMVYVEKERGVARTSIGDISGYLVRFPENVPEISSVEMDGKTGEVMVKTDQDYLRKKGVDYILQTALFLVFSIMILAEYRLFMDGLKAK